MQRNWRDISYLQSGSPRQRGAYVALRELRLIEELQGFDPIVVGTIPIGIDTPDSDLDVACHAQDSGEFQSFLHRQFGAREGFASQKKMIRGRESLIVRFLYKETSFELFGQDLPSIEQDAFQHMLVEHRILYLSNEHTRLRVKRLKSSGRKTEPVFAELLELKGDPYAELLKLAAWDDATLSSHLRKVGLV